VSLLLVTAAGSARRDPGVLAFDGDSITAGYGLASPSTEGWPALVVAMLEADGLSFTAGNVAISGQTTEDMNTTHTDLDALVNPFAWWGYSGGARNVLVSFSGTNDLFFGASAATTIARIETRIAQAFAAGFNRIVLGSMLKRDQAELPPSFEADRVTVNTAQAAMANGSTIFYADFASLATLEAGDFADGIHPDAPENAIMAPYFYDQVVAAITA
jgi:lysophospholipase L1-like esterase